MPFPPPGDLPDPGIKPASLASPALAGGFFTTAAAAAKSLQSCPTLCDPIDGSPPGSFVHGLFQARILAAAAKSLQLCPTLLPHRRQPTRLPCPWDSPGKNTGVGCQFLLQCMKVKSESEVAQSCPTLSDPMDCSLPDSSVHGIFQAREYWSGLLISISRGSS